MNSDEEFSLVLNEALDILGYNKDNVEAKRKAYDRMSAQMTTLGTCSSDLEGYCTITGSRREGLADPNISDRDVMFTCTKVLCSDSPESERDDVKYIFKLDRDGCPHGYTKLRLFKRNKIDEDSCLSLMIENSLIEDADDSQLLSSTLFNAEVLAMHSMDSSLSHLNAPMSGPSLPISHKKPYFPSGIDMDRVYAFRCKCSDYLQSWTKRPRDFDWPSKEQIDTAATLDAHVVPVGPKGSGEEHLQWRICYTLTEVNLMQSLNETKWKLYATLKIIKDEMFKQLDGQLLTSYVLKNVVMWISESDPIEEFQPKYLLHKLRQCFDFLALCFASKRIPNYMISERNMLDGRLTDANTAEHTAAVINVRKDPIATIRLCSKIKHALDQVTGSRQGLNKLVRPKFTLETTTANVFSRFTPAQFESLRNTLHGSEKQQVDATLQFIVQSADVFADISGIPEAQIVDWFRWMQTIPIDKVTPMIAGAVNSLSAKYQ